MQLAKGPNEPVPETSLAEIVNGNPEWKDTIELICQSPTTALTTLFMFLPNVGIGGLVRINRSSLSYGTANGQTVHFDAGGVQGGVGLRLRF